MGDNKERPLIQQIATMRERTEQLCRAFQTSDAAIVSRLQIVHALFCAIETYLQNGVAVDCGSIARLTKEDIDDIAAAVARKLDRSTHPFDEPSPAPKRRPS